MKTAGELQTHGCLETGGYRQRNATEHLSLQEEAEVRFLGKLRHSKATVYTYEKLTAITIRSDKRLKAFFLLSGTRQECSLHHSIQHSTGSPS